MRLISAAPGRSWVPGQWVLQQAVSVEDQGNSVSEPGWISFHVGLVGLRQVRGVRDELEVGCRNSRDTFNITSWA